MLLKSFRLDEVLVLSCEFRASGSIRWSSVACSSKRGLLATGNRFRVFECFQNSRSVLGFYGFWFCNNIKCTTEALK
ncbi:hypothetical protein SLEP1_g19606 [Rubroshorea leprosula]|uniref:Uncharacterized protein n=1 Tax=Rubroshorea leprosula TaxID=152421 RepID=A0AAV5J5U0_9ROSI|nr:hypothetical protein SLEP1_g19606 [Rubroshorea leprosula]